MPELAGGDCHRHTSTHITPSLMSRIIFRYKYCCDKTVLGILTLPLGGWEPMPGEWGSPRGPFRVSAREYHFQLTEIKAFCKFFCVNA